MPKTVVNRTSCTQSDLRGFKWDFVETAKMSGRGQCAIHGTSCVIGLSALCISKPNTALRRCRSIKHSEVLNCILLYTLSASSLPLPCSNASASTYFQSTCSIPEGIHLVRGNADVCDRTFVPLFHFYPLFVFHQTTTTFRTSCLTTRVHNH